MLTETKVSGQVETLHGIMAEFDTLVLLPHEVAVRRTRSASGVTRSTSAASGQKSADRIEGASFTPCTLRRASEPAREAAEPT